MNEAQERNVIQFVKNISVPLPEVYKDYVRYCKKRSAEPISPEELEEKMRKGETNILTIEGEKYVFGLRLADDPPPKVLEPYFKGQLVTSEEFKQWLYDHGWVGKTPLDE